MPDGATGVLLAKGPGVMSGGYWKDDAATKAAFVDGYFNTGATRGVGGVWHAHVPAMCTPPVSSITAQDVNISRLYCIKALGNAGVL